MKKKEAKVIAKGINTARIVMRHNNVFFEFGFSHGMVHVRVDISEMFPKLVREIISLAKAGEFDKHLDDKELK